ncbi:MAG: hypothetical protein BWX88_03439 [Planctomycetes bacterium ADurb.Bin126]|nr:MAG: hypothetical protein BWX88_03439 [Planctomycetes bacterium ADurb.Bin126]HOD81763.1 hypothetical protein [Phycisphaerae bacterium]HQL74695.1 hypothetical protein [Phycisphaerae bacterium]
MTLSADPLQTILDRVQRARRTGPRQWQASCPAHDDRHASLSIGQGDDGRVLIDCKAGCPTLEVLKAMGLKFSDLYPLPVSPARSGSDDSPRGRIVSTYDYRDEGGTLLFQVVRFDPKDFRQRRPDGKGGWTWKLGNTPRVLYRLPELLAADVSEWVFQVEGEKDADNLARLGLVATTNPGGAGKWNKLADDLALHGRRVAVLGDKDTPGRAHAQDVATRLRGKAAEIKIIELPGESKDVSDWLQAGGTADQLLALVESAPADHARRARPSILIDTQEHRVVCETIEALCEDPDLYQRGNILVRVLRETQPRDDVIRRCSGSATIQAIPVANLRERMTRYASFTKLNRKKEEVPAHPTPWLVSAVDARGDWPGMRALQGVSDTPILRPDGSVWQTPGFDAATGVLFESNVSFPPVHPEVTIDDALVALDQLLEVVCDFKFESDEHRSAWLAGLLTPLARFAYEGPSPLFLIDANVRGAGKGLLAQTIGLIVLGREMPVSSYAHDSDEMRKRITAIAIAGDRMILLDNLEGAFGNDALDRALTSTRWKDRVLGKSQEMDLPLLPCWYATGNNVSVAADTARRVIHVRLDVLEERPEERTGFKHPNLSAWIAENRPRLLSAALTVLSAYCRAGQPVQDLTPYGSFEGWSALVRQAVVWLGLPDPCLTRIKLAESSDTTADVLGQLIAAWKTYAPNGAGVVVTDMLNTLYPAQGQFFPQDPLAKTMRAALETLVGCPAGKAPTARQVSNKIKCFRRRVFDGVYLDFNQHEYNRAGAVWRLHNA